MEGKLVVKNINIYRRSGRKMKVRCKRKEGGRDGKGGKEVDAIDRVWELQNKEETQKSRNICNEVIRE